MLRMVSCAYAMVETTVRKMPVRCEGEGRVAKMGAPTIGATAATPACARAVAAAYATSCCTAAEWSLLATLKVNAEVAPLNVPDGLKVPHMGWNNIRLSRPHKLFDGLDGANMYFVHSYAARFADDDMIDIIATSDYGQPIVAALGHDNMVGTQFHPEKSQRAGLQLIANFLEWRP